MENSFWKQAADFLRNKKSARRWLVLFLCLAVAVTTGTFAALKLNGQATTRKSLTCSYEVHKHTDDCYEQVDGKKTLVCGYADYVVHSHDSKCYDESGKLVCKLDQVEKHEHTKDCFETKRVLTCKEEESKGHTHSDKCYTEKKTLSCGKEESEGHSHDDSCYDADGNLTCGKEESKGHTHSDECYTVEKTLTCGKEESKGHTHSDACYSEEKVATCGKLELHTHTDKCFKTKADAQDKDGDGIADGRPICGIPELKEHQHDDNCFTDVKGTASDDNNGGLFAMTTNDDPEPDPAGASMGDSGMEGPSIGDETADTNGSDGIAPIANGDAPKTIAVDSQDLAAFLKEAKLTQGEDEIKEGDTVIVGEHYTYHVSFDETTGGKKFSEDMYFDLPKNVKCSPVENKEIYDPDYKDGKEPAGTYSIDENGRVTFQLKKEYLESRTNLDMDLSFDLTVEESSSGTMAFPWTNGGEPQIFKIDPNPDAQLKKTVGDYNPADPQGPCIDYTVELEITKGMVKNPKIEDQMGAGLSYRKNSGEVKVLDEDGKDITSEYKPAPSLKWTAGGWEVENMPKSLSKGQKMVVTYQSDVDFTKVNGEASQGNFSFTAENKAVFTGDSPAGGTIKKDADTKKPITDELVEKTGKQDSKHPENLDWEIVVGSGSTDVRGATVKDTLSGDQWIDTSRNLELKWKDAGGNTMVTYYIPWDKAQDYGLTPVTDKDGKITGFEFEIPKGGKAPDGSDFWSKDGRTWQPGDRIKIEYYTKYGNSPGERGNTASVDVNEKTFTGTDSVGIGAGTISKNGKLSDDEKYMEYTVELSIPSAQDLQEIFGTSNNYTRFYLRDQLEFTDVEMEDGRTVRYFVDNYPENVQITVTPQGENSIEFKEVKPGTAENQFEILKGEDYTNGEKEKKKAAREFRIMFNRYLKANVADRDEDDSYWTLDKPCTMKITYKVKTDSKLYMQDPQTSDGTLGNIVDTDLTVLDLLKQGKTLTNEITAKGNKESFSAKHKYTGERPVCGVSKDAKIVSQDSDNPFDNVIEYRVAFNGFTTDVQTGKTGTVAIDPRTFYLEDAFDSRLEYVKDSLQIEVYAPDSNRHRYTFKYADPEGPVFETKDGVTTMTARADKFSQRTHQGNPNDDDKDNLWDYMWDKDKNAAKSRDALYVFVYKLRVKDEYFTGENLQLKNNATVHYGNASKSDDATVDFKPETLIKNGVHDTESGRDIVRYTVEVNPAGANMVTTEREDLDPERYTLTDHMDKTLTLRSDSVKVYCIEEDGSKKELTAVSDQAQVKKDGDCYVLQEAAGNTFKLILPDEKHIRIEYSADVNAAHGTQVTVTNMIEMEGGMSISDESKAEFKVDENTASIRGDAKMRLFKRDALGGNYLDGAEFKLYSIKAEGNGEIQAKIGENRYQFETYGTLTPKALEGADIGQKQDYPGKYYLLVETKAPDGYILNPTPVVVVFGKPEAGDPSTIPVEYDGKTYEAQIQYIVTGDNVVVIDNQHGAYELPESGGIGNTKTYAMGMLLALAAAGALVYTTRKRRKEGN